MIVKYVFIYYDGEQVAKYNASDLIGFDGRISSLPGSIFPENFDKEKVAINYLIDRDQLDLVSYNYNGKNCSAPYVPYCIMPKNKTDFKNISFNGYGGLFRFKIPTASTVGFKTVEPLDFMYVVTDKLDGIEIKDIFNPGKIIRYY